MANRKKYVDTNWSGPLAYVIGLIAADGNLSPDGRHISFTSKDSALAKTFKRILCLDNTIGIKARGGSTHKKYHVVQFGSVDFYTFLLSIGLTPAKSKTIGELLIPSQYFPDFLRGCIDGDGSISTFSHPESKYSQLRVRLASASPKFLKWVHVEISRCMRTNGGWVYTDSKKSVATLTYATADSVKILTAIYRSSTCDCLHRKKKTATKYLAALK
ncbi:MAG: LAGLIDADG family homing endonuclease [Candidatus Paceibacterota bacterium]